MKASSKHLRPMFLRALTPIHAGAGRGYEGHVDLPLQRDEFEVPCIWASSLKGALRQAIASNLGDEKGCLRACMGAEPGSPEVREYASSVGFLDARLLFLPTRTLKRVWVYASSPHLLGYLANYLEASGTGYNVGGFVGKLGLPASSVGDIIVDGATYLNEVELRGVKFDPNLYENLQLSSVVPKDLLEKIKGRGLVLVGEEQMKTIVRRGMVLHYRVRLKYETKTVDRGALWSEEYMPQETILVAAVKCQPPRRMKEGCDDCCRWLEDSLRNLNWGVWLGGKETIGRGLLKIYMG